MTYAIKWNLLTDDELHYLDKVGIERGPTGIAFSRDLSWNEFTLAFAYLTGLDRRTLQEGNHVAFAIGDCMIEGERLFGEERIQEWVDEFLRLRSIRDLVLNQVGGALILLQEVENDFKSCCSLAPLEGLNLSPGDFLSPDLSRRKQTMGHLAKALKDSRIFSGEFETRLTNLVNNRNHFIHHLWIEKWRQTSGPTGLPSEEEFFEVQSFVANLVKDALFVRDVLRGFTLELMRSYYPNRYVDPGPETPFASWSRYLPKFHEMIRKAGGEDVGNSA